MLKNFDLIGMQCKSIKKIYRNKRRDNYHPISDAKEYAPKICGKRKPNDQTQDIEDQEASKCARTKRSRLRLPAERPWFNGMPRGARKIR